MQDEGGGDGARSCDARADVGGDGQSRTLIPWPQTDRPMP
jgi:hypothetical protein